jgi:hypothetical protein
LNDEIKKKNQNIQKDKKIAIVRKKKGLRPPRLTHQTHELGYEIGIAR